MSYYEKCCEQRLADLIKHVSAALPGQTITAEYVFKNAPLKNIAKSSAATQRMIDWCNGEQAKRLKVGDDVHVSFVASVIGVHGDVLCVRGEHGLGVVDTSEVVRVEQPEEK